MAAQAPKFCTLAITIYCCCNLDLAVTIVKNRSGHLKDSEKNENNILLKTRFKRKNQLFIIDQQFL